MCEEIHESSFGEKLEKILNKKLMTQKELANKLNVPASTLNGYIKGYREPNIQFIKKVVAALNVSADELLDTELKLKKKERKLIQAFRKLSKKQRKKILEKIEFMVLFNEINIDYENDDDDDDDFE